MSSALYGHISFKWSYKYGLLFCMNSFPQAEVLWLFQCVCLTTNLNLLLARLKFTKRLKPYPSNVTLQKYQMSALLNDVYRVQGHRKKNRLMLSSSEPLTFQCHSFIVLASTDM